jgi:two-component system LytT family sensor kinase
MKDELGLPRAECPNWWRVWMGMLILWAIFAALGTCFNFQLSAVRGRPISWFQSIRMNLVGYGIWAMVLTPIVLLLCAKIPLARKHWLWFVSAHLLSMAAVLCIDVLIKTLWGGRVYPNLSFLPFVPQFRRILFSEGEADIQIYLMVAVIGYVVAYYNQLRSQEWHQAELETSLVRAKLQNLKMQLQPHFLFNALHSVGALVNTDPRAAQKMICSLGDLLRISLAGLDLPEASLRRELEFLELYLDIQKVRFQDQLLMEIDVPADLLEARVPYLLLQSLVENAIKHGVARRTGRGKVEIVVRRESATVCVRVTNDNGLSHYERENDRLGIGLDNIRSRIRILYGVQGQLSVQELANGKFQVVVRVPFRPETLTESESRFISSVA